jgi:hypothetical protein
VSLAVGSANAVGVRRGDEQKRLGLSGDLPGTGLLDRRQLTRTEGNLHFVDFQSNLAADRLSDDRVIDRLAADLSVRLESRQRDPGAGRLSRP